MLYFPQTRIELTVERPVVAGVTINAEGAALAGVFAAGVYGVQPSTGTNDIFAGVAVNQPIQPSTLPFIEEVIVSTTGVIQLSYVPISGTVYVYNTATGVALTNAASAPTSGQWMYDATNTSALDTNVSNSGVTLTVAYRYSPTVLQAMGMQGMVLPGGPAGAYLGQVGVITRGDVYTSEFDTSADWATAVGVVLQANGHFGATAVAANAIQGVQIIQQPSAGSAYLGLFVNVPN